MSTFQQPPTHAAEPSMKDKAAEAMEQGRDSAGQVAGTATEQAQQVKDEAVRQARDLLGEARQHVGQQVSGQHRNLIDNLRSLSAELGSMVDRSDGSGPATDLVTQARQRVDGAANWLDAREPGQLVDEVKNFARQRPGTFLLGALAAGMVAGRLTRGVVAAHTDESPTAGGQHAADSQTRSAPGYAMGGGYTDPSGQPQPEPELGYGATSTYGDGAAPPPPPPYPPAADYPEVGGPRYPGGYAEGGPVR